MTSTNTDKYCKALIIGLVIYNLIALLGKCNRPEPIGKTEQLPAEPIRQRVVQLDTTERAKFRKLAAERLTRIEALQRTIIAETGKRKQAEQKARESANTYAKTPTLLNCDKALQDCQEENETKAYSLAVQERMLSEYDSLNTLQVSEIARQSAVIDTLSNGWQAANAENAKLAKKVTRKNKLLKIGGGIIAVLAGVVAIR